MAYSKAYQEKHAGRIREEEAIGILKGNTIVTPARTASLNPVCGKKQVTVDSLGLEDTQVGKNDNRSAGLVTDLPPSVH